MRRLILLAIGGVWDRCEYLGSFRCPQRRTTDLARYGYGGGSLAVSPDGRTLCLEGHTHGQLVAGLAIPG